MSGMLLLEIQDLVLSLRVVSFKVSVGVALIFVQVLPSDLRRTVLS